MTTIEFIRSLPEAEKERLLNILIPLLLAPETIPVTNEELIEMLDWKDLWVKLEDLYR
jgi:hypothetical protein